jgi:hypothetical protein
MGASLLAAILWTGNDAKEGIKYLRRPKEYYAQESAYNDEPEVLVTVISSSPGPKL